MPDIFYHLVRAAGSHGVGFGERMPTHIASGHIIRKRAFADMIRRMLPNSPHCRSPKPNGDVRGPFHHWFSFRQTRPDPKSLVMIQTDLR